MLIAHCNTMMQWDALGDKLADIDSVEIGKMDYTANEIDVEGVNVQVHARCSALVLWSIRQLWCLAFVSQSGYACFAFLLLLKYIEAAMHACRGKMECHAFARR